MIVVYNRDTNGNNKHTFHILLDSIIRFQQFPILLHVQGPTHWRPWQSSLWKADCSTSWYLCICVCVFHVILPTVCTADNGDFLDEENLQRLMNQILRQSCCHLEHTSHPHFLVALGYPGRLHNERTSHPIYDTAHIDFSSLFAC